jgi:hypothetical protein
VYDDAMRVHKNSNSCLKNKQYLNKGDHSHSIIHYTSPEKKQYLNKGDHSHTLQSQEILNRPVFVLDILKRV